MAGRVVSKSRLPLTIGLLGKDHLAQRKTWMGSAGPDHSVI